MNSIDTLKILEKTEKIDWDYDEEADVLYLSFGEPKKSVGLDVGEGVIVRYDQTTREVNGLTIIGLKKRSLSAIKLENKPSVNFSA